MIERYGADAMAPITSRSEDTSKEDVCRAWSRLFAETARLPASEGGRMARWLLSP